LSHNDFDHAGGLVELVAAGKVGTLIVSRFNVAGAVQEAALLSSTTVVEVERGDRLRIGSVRIEVLSPMRRFASENDGSVVLLLTAGLSVLLPGDIESVGQADLPTIRPDVMVVPHHGSATTDLQWLASVVGPVVILSYGPNTYGHPHQDVLAILEESGAIVRSTNAEGDVSFPLARANR
jgi:beta-lactamase superfamily II metal-dependent hydrolase